ncbi:hypothetical protein THAOC_14487, partial [Thalassiosira oceanica]
ETEASASHAVFVGRAGPNLTEVLGRVPPTTDQVSRGHSLGGKAGTLRGWEDDSRKLTEQIGGRRIGGLRETRSEGSCTFVGKQDAFKPDEPAGGSRALLLLPGATRRGAAANVDASPDRRACLQPLDQGRGQRAGHDEHPHLRHAGVRPARQDVGRVALQGHGVPRELRQGEERHPAAPRPGPPRRRRRAGPAAGGDVRRGRGQEGGVRGDGLPVAASPGLRGRRRRRRRLAGRTPVVRLPSEARAGRRSHRLRQPRRGSVRGQVNEQRGGQ